MLLTTGAALLVNTVVGDKGILATIAAKREFEHLRVTVANTRIENAKLREEARRLREDVSTIEELARRDLGLIKPGEKLFIVHDVRSSHPGR